MAEGLLVAAFLLATNADDREARELLQIAAGDLQQAIDLFFDRRRRITPAYPRITILEAGVGAGLATGRASSPSPMLPPPSWPPEMDGNLRLHAALEDMPKAKAMTFKFTGKSLGAAAAKELADMLERYPNCTGLDLSGNNLRARGAEHIARALQGTVAIGSLSLRRNLIGPEGAQHIAAALRRNAPLSILDLSINQIGPEGASYLGLALRVNSTVTSFDLSNNRITDDGVPSLAEGLRVNTTLQVLLLSFNELHLRGISSLFEALKVNTGLTTLDISFNEIGLQGVRCVAGALCRNSTLTSLDLSCTGMGDAGAAELAEALACNLALTTLSLRLNRVGNLACQKLSLALRSNTPLSFLDLSHNEITSEGAEHLAAGLEANSCLTSLKLDSKISESVAWRLEEALQKNRNPPVVLTVQCQSLESSLVAVTCLTLAGEEAARFEFPLHGSMANFEERALLAVHPRLSPLDHHVRFVMPDGRLTRQLTKTLTLAQVLGQGPLRPRRESTERRPQPPPQLAAEAATSPAGSSAPARKQQRKRRWMPFHLAADGQEVRQVHLQEPGSSSRTTGTPVLLPRAAQVGREAKGEPPCKEGSHWRGRRGRWRSKTPGKSQP